MYSYSLEYVQDFTYLGSLISRDNAGQKDIHTMLGKAREAFARLKTICCVARIAGESPKAT